MRLRLEDLSAGTLLVNYLPVSDLRGRQVLEPLTALLGLLSSEKLLWQLL